MSSKPRSRNRVRVPVQAPRSNSFPPTSHLPSSETDYLCQSQRADSIRAISIDFLPLQPHFDLQLLNIILF